MKRVLLFFVLFLSSLVTFSQKHKVKLVRNQAHPSVEVYVGGKHFTDFFFPDTIAKPVLYPIYAPDGVTITRGFPVNPKPGDPTDHPHHLGLWLNYENVNGLDFWNNSFAIPAEKKDLYGTIRFDGITQLKDGPTGLLSYDASWVDNSNKIHVKESTTYAFSELGGSWVIDRNTTLSAVIPVLFKDAKDGFLGLRVAHELQIPTKESKKYTDSKGIVTEVLAVTDSIANGNYVNSNGLYGDAVWSAKAPWCMMYGKMGKDSISVLIIDHPKNLGYPTNWHARGYGLFAANPLGEKIFTNGKAERNFSLRPGESVTFRYRIVVSSGKNVLSNERVTKLQEDFKGREE
jgi:hypothetical protein